MKVIDSNLILKGDFIINLNLFMWKIMIHLKCVLYGTQSECMDDIDTFFILKTKTFMDLLVCKWRIWPLALYLTR